MSVLSSVEPSRRKRTLAHTSRAIWRREIRPLRYAARAKWRALEPSMSVLSRSKKAAVRRGLCAIHFEDHRVALATAGADGGDAEPASAAAQLVRERAEDAGAAGADRGPGVGARGGRMGAPGAMPPPLTFTLESSIPSMRMEFTATEANASLISNR